MLFTSETRNIIESKTFLKLLYFNNRYNELIDLTINKKFNIIFTLILLGKK